MGEYEFMDLLYSKYASPMDFMKTYMDSGQFGEWVSEIIRLENKRKQEEAEKYDDDKLWLMYLLSGSEYTFNDWKAQVTGHYSGAGNVPVAQHGPVQSKPKGNAYSMSSEEIASQKEKARNILKGFKV